MTFPNGSGPGSSLLLGNQMIDVATALQSRAPVHLRVNLIKSDIPGAISALNAEGIKTTPSPACETALEVIEGARKIAQSRAYADGLVELQDAASQAVVAALDLRPGMRVLDYCAGGGRQIFGAGGASGR